MLAGKAMRTIRKLMKDVKSTDVTTSRNAINKIVQFLGHKDEKVQLKAIESLQQIKVDKTIVPLLNAMKSTNDNMCLGSVYLLSKTKHPRAIDAFINMLTHIEDRMRFLAAKSLADMNAVSAIKPLIDRLGDRSSEVRITAAKALGRIDADDELKKGLKEALNHNNRDVRQTAKKILDAVK